MRMSRIVLIMGFIGFAVTVWSEPRPSCNSNYVSHSLNGWTVLPNGNDDTANLQCAFDEAAKGHGAAVQLIAGTYHTGQVAVSGFMGVFRGAGMNATTIETLDRQLKVAPVDFNLKPPTPENGSNPWPSIFAFVGGDVVISDLSLYTTGNAGTTGWILSVLGFPIYELAHGFIVVGPLAPGQGYSEANAALYRVHIEGLPKGGTLLGYNLINGIYYEGILGVTAPATFPLKGKFTVRDSEFRSMAGGTNLLGLFEARVSIIGNRYLDSFEGMDIGSVSNTVYKFSNNEISNSLAWGVDLYGAFQSSTILINNNEITGNGMGLDLDDSLTFSGDVKCGLLKNDVRDVQAVGVYLSAGTRNCLVVCKARTDTVQDLGTDNTVIGCHKF